MEKNYTVVFDSGIGGLNVLYELASAFPEENFIYLADNKNTPYGKRHTRELLNMTLNALAPALCYKVQAVVLGCNTLSVTIRQELQHILNIDVFGVYPPVETALKKGGNALLLATNKTAEYFSKVYAKVSKNERRLFIAPLPYLASEIEDMARELTRGGKEVTFSPFSQALKKHYINITPQINRIPIFSKIDTLILGCTHYNFIEKELFDHFKPNFITSGIPLTVESYKKSKKMASLAKKTIKTIQKGKICFLGENAQLNRKVFYQFFFKEKLKKNNQKNQKNL